MRRKMILLGIMIQMLSAIRKIETGHATGCTFAGQIQLGKVLRQLRADGAEDPIEVAIAFDADALVTKVPNVFAPRLQFDKLETCSLHDFDFDDTCVKRSHLIRSVKPTREHRLHLRPRQ